MSQDILTFEQFAEKYAQEHNQDIKTATAVIWANGSYVDYKQSRRNELGIKTCEECDTDQDVSKYYCGQLGCGKGSWCKKNKYRLCGNCATDRVDW